MTEKTQYKVLARKYRPQKFADLIGQEILVQILTNAIMSKRIANAYLLTGIRGVGKTTTARLIAKALNCQSNQDDKIKCSTDKFCATCEEIINSNELALLQNIPNPTNGITTIKFNNPISDVITLLITDMFGKVVFSEDISSVVGMNELNLNLNLSSGVYNYSIQNDEEILSKRMIISE